MLSTAEVGLFHLPVGYTKSPSGKATIKKEVKEWLNKSNANIFQKTSYGTYAGIASCLIGGLSWLFGVFKKNKIATLIGSILAPCGAALALFGKFCGVEFDVVDTLNNKAIYNPPAELKTTPKEEGILQHEEVTISTNDGEKLFGYYVPSPTPTKKTVIFLHGRANNISHCLKDIVAIQKKIPVNVLIADYRGFGKSTLNTGEISRDSIVTDAKAMYDYLIEKRGYKGEDISLYGHSLGGAVAIELAKKITQEKKPLHSIIIQSSFTSIHDVAQSHLSTVFPDTLARILTALSKNEFDSKKSIKEIDPKIKILIAHGTDDGVIPFKQSEELYNEALTKDKKLILLKGAHHSDCSEHFNSEYIDTLQGLVAA